MIEDKSLQLAFGKKVHKAREKQGMSQALLAERAKLDRTFIGGIERGTRNPTLQSVFKIAGALRLDPKDLLPNPRWL